MEYFTEQASTHTECLQKIRAKYGENAKVLMQKTVRLGGILGFFARDGVEMTGVISAEGPRYARKPTDLEEEKKKILAAANKSDPTLLLVLNEVRNIKERMDASTANAGAAEEHPSIVRIAGLMAQNDFSAAFSATVRNRIKKEFSLEALADFNALQDKVVEWIGESIRIYREDGFQTRPRVLVLIGPTGVGKTTTIAKLAAIYGLGGNASRPLSVRMVTIDNYRIAARQQIETYGNIMGIPVSCVETFDDLRKTIALYSQDVDLILVDTIGKSPRDNIKLAEMKQLLAACGSGAEVHLAMAATTKASDIREILQQFEPFNYRSVIVTKLDETIRVGNVVSALSEKGKSVSYVTDGQRVPQDIERASVVKFLINLEGFRLDRRRMEELFPKADSDLKQWR